TGQKEPILGTADDMAFYGDCSFGSGSTLSLNVLSNAIKPNEWQKHVCQFVSPVEVSDVIVIMETGNSAGMTFDALQLEEGEFDTRFVDGVADLEEKYLKIAPDEYQCTGNEAEDHPACANFARVCKQTEVGCQGYTDIEDPTAPEIPASLSLKDQCQSVCSGYGEYRKLASAFDLVQDLLYPEFNDPEDQTVAYFIPSTAQTCSLQDIGCEAFTSMEAATSTGEQIAYYNQLRNCEKPNDQTRTYFTWEGSDTTGYQLRTWALIASSTTDEAPRVILKGALLGSVKDPNTCNEVTWKSGVDPDCRQFYDASGNVYYRFYSQTVSSDNSCTLYRKDNSSLADCTKTGGTEYQPQTKSCMYLALPSESLSCSANAGGCRAYLGPTGRNAANVYDQAFNDAESTGWFVNNPNTTVTLSQESVLVGDQSVKLEPIPTTGPIDAEISLPLPSTSTLYRISFWAKSTASSQEASTVTIDGQQVGSFQPSVIWQRFEFGPFFVQGNATQVTQQVQRTCGNFNLAETAALRTSIEQANPGAEPAQIDLLVASALSSAWSNPNQQCTSDADCSLPVQDGGVQIGTAQGSCLFQDVTASVKIHMPANTGVAFIDTMRVDQLNDIRFVRDNSWSTPAVCDATFPEGVPEPRAMLGCRAYNDRDGNTVYVRQFGSLCSEDKIGCKAFIDTRDMPTPYPQTISVNGTAGPSVKGEPGSTERPDVEARIYDEQFLGDWSITSKPYRYYYAIDDDSARCDSGEAMCRAFGKPLFNQDRLQLQSTEYSVTPSEALYDTQKQIYSFETVLLKYDWQSLVDNNGGLKLACRKDELFCQEFKSGNVTEYFRDPGDHTCEWVEAKELKTNVENGIFSDGVYKGWFRTGTDIPCYRDYLGYGDTYLLQYSGESRYAGWVAGCPIDQSECTEFVDPNDTTDPTRPTGKSYYLINSNKLDTRSCGATADPLSGCLLFNNKSIPELYANSQATYDKVIENKGQAQTYVDCDGNPDDPNCAALKSCQNLNIKIIDQGAYSDSVYKQIKSSINNALTDKQNDENWVGNHCQTNDDCTLSLQGEYSGGGITYAVLGAGNVTGECKTGNDSNVVLKVKLDRECARWMGCKTGETVFDQGLQKFVNQCNELEVCQETGKNDDIYCQSLTDRQKEELLKPGEFISLENYSAREIGFGKMDYSGYTIPNQYVLADIEPRSVGYELLSSEQNNDQYRYDKHLVAHLPMSLTEIIPFTDPLFTEFDLCQDTRTGRIGYQTDGGEYCNFAINEPQSLSLAVGGQGGTDDSRDIQNIYDSFLAGNASKKNSLLQSAMPAPECQLYPEETSPLSDEYVETWNDNVAPPVPDKMVDGYDFATACAYGEDCTCSYRKVRYQGGAERYYAIDGQAPSVGICIGGDTEGASCVPGGYVPVNSKNQILVGQKTNNTFGTDTQCGTGVCYSIQDVVVMNGKYAYCLERDRTRASGVSQASAPCLTWSPEVVIGGKYDTTHYSPTAGYLPPQGSGEYYCVSGANEQRLETPITEVNQWDTYLHSWTGPYFWSPGKLIQFGYSRADVWWKPSDDTYDNVSIDGAHNYVTIVGEDSLDNISADNQANSVSGAATKNMRFACRRATICDGTIFDSGWDRTPANGHKLEATAKEGRWIMTGNSITNSYMEYFIPAGYGISSVNEKYYDYRFGLF
ncbi:hypothetical protein KKG46_04440, partial [Patescibacteria group bacterium]|nr:hypothetical protein [Patescibacteria group bacterium]